VTNSLLVLMMKSLSSLSKIFRGAWMAMRNGLAGPPSLVEKEEAVNVNAHLENYLNYYQTLEAPRFAVLITGEWGTGKTYLVRKLLPSEGEGAKAVYASLFGLKSAEDVVAAIYAEMHPSEHKLQENIEKVGDAIKGVSVAGFGVGGVGSAFASLVSAKLRKEVDASKTIVLDDLERSEISDKALLGIINHYVEHHRCRVVVIAHDEKLVQGIKEAKEKIFGQTIRIEPDLESAYQAFLPRSRDQMPRNLLPFTVERLRRFSRKVTFNHYVFSARQCSTWFVCSRCLTGDIAKIATLCRKCCRYSWRMILRFAVAVSGKRSWNGAMASSSGAASLPKRSRVFLSKQWLDTRKSTLQACY
jgi:hypothetical protein